MNRLPYKEMKFTPFCTTANSQMKSIVGSEAAELNAAEIWIFWECREKESNKRNLIAHSLRGSLFLGFPIFNGHFRANVLMRRSDTILFLCE